MKYCRKNVSVSERCCLKSVSCVTEIFIFNAVELTQFDKNAAKKKSNQNWFGVPVATT